MPGRNANPLGMLDKSDTEYPRRFWYYAMSNGRGLRASRVVVVLSSAMSVLLSIGTSATNYLLTRNYIAEVLNLQLHYCEIFKPGNVA